MKYQLHSIIESKENLRLIKKSCKDFRFHADNYNFETNWGLKQMEEIYQQIGQHLEAERKYQQNPKMI